MQFLVWASAALPSAEPFRICTRTPVPACCETRTLRGGNEAASRGLPQRQAELPASVSGDQVLYVGAFVWAEPGR